MAVRLALGLAGLILGYGIVTGPFLFNLVFDTGAVFTVLALVLALATERTPRVLWPLVITAAGFPTVIGLQTFALPDCGPSLAQGVACLAVPERRSITVVATLVAALALGLAVWDLRSSAARRVAHSAAEAVREGRR